MYLCEREFFGPMSGPYEQALAAVLNNAYRDFVAWNKGQAKPVTHPRFTPARVGRKARTSFPSLSSKGAASKALTRWLAARMHDLVAAAGSTQLDRDVASCVVAYNEMLAALDNAELLLDAAAAARIYSLGQLHLVSYSNLRLLSSRTLGARSCNKNCWLILPKHHHLLHMITDTVMRDGLNPRFQMLFCGESFIGQIGRMAKSCHRSSLSTRLLQRYRIRFGLELQGLA